MYVSIKLTPYDPDILGIVLATSERSFENEFDIDFLCYTKDEYKVGEVVYRVDANHDDLNFDYNLRKRKDFDYSKKVDLVIISEKEFNKLNDDIGTRDSLIKDLYFMIDQYEKLYRSACTRSEFKEKHNSE